jgi:hypothetical protein
VIEIRLMRQVMHVHTVGSSRKGFGLERMLRRSDRGEKEPNA